MERDDRAVATFFVADALAAGITSTLGEGAAHHARVRRLAAGDRVRLTDGAGTLAAGTIEAVRKNDVAVTVDRAWNVAPLSPLHLLVPIGDKDRMLLLAEKATEIGISSWQPVRFQRSASVSPRGEGSGFAAKVRARMISALEQSGGAWLPEIRVDTALDDVRLPEHTLGLLLDGAGEPIVSYGALAARGQTAILFGPEGGLAPDEISTLERNGWRKASLGPTTLRFETAGIVAAGIVRAMTSTPL